MPKTRESGYMTITSHFPKITNISVICLFIPYILKIIEFLTTHPPYNSDCETSPAITWYKLQSRPNFSQCLGYSNTIYISELAFLTSMLNQLGIVIQ